MSQFIHPPQRSNLLWIATDLDGTMAEPLWTPENPCTEIGKPMEHNLAKYRAALELGRKGVIHTSRPWSDYEAIESWMGYHGLPFSHITCGKLLGVSYIDDRAIHESAEDWTNGSHCGTCRC